MSLVYISSLDKFIYDKDFQIIGNTFSYKFIYASKSPVETDDSIWIHYKTPMNQIVELIKHYGKTYDLVIIDDNLHLLSNLPVKPSEMYKYPNGETCKKALKIALNKVVGYKYLVAQDDGTKSTLPPIYYSLLSLNKLNIYRVFPSIVYAKNYLSCSDSIFSRAKMRLNITDIRIEPVDYVITPGFKDNEKNKILYKWCRALATKGLIIFTKVTDALPIPQRFIHFHDLLYFYCYDFLEDNYTTYDCIKSKPSNLELLPFLRSQRG